LDRRWWKSLLSWRWFGVENWLSNKHVFAAILGLAICAHRNVDVIGQSFTVVNVGSAMEVVWRMVDGEVVACWGSSNRNLLQ
jgi:hypothetical protein